MTTGSIVCGVVTLVQERRFQLVDGSGAAHLYLIAADASFDASGLEPYLRSGAELRITYRQAPGLIARLATAAVPLTAEDTHEAPTT